MFGSNLRGAHSAGAAKQALEKFGAKRGEGFGHFGKSFALPTRDENIETLPLDRIKVYVDQFIKYAENNPQLTFLLTPVGTGLAGIPAEKMAPLFKDAPLNVILPKEFAEILDVD